MSSDWFNLLPSVKPVELFYIKCLKCLKRSESSRSHLAASFAIQSFFTILLFKEYSFNSLPVFIARRTVFGLRKNKILMATDRELLVIYMLELLSCQETSLYY